MKKFICTLHPALIVAVDALLVYSLAKEAISDLKEYIKKKKASQDEPTAPMTE